VLFRSPARRGFAVAALGRLAEAALRPPDVVRRVAAGDRGDRFARVDVPAVSTGTAGLVAAAARAVTGWNGSARRVVAAVGASERPGAAVEPRDESAYFRLRLPSSPDASSVRAALGQRPEPAVPGRVARAAAELLAHRLGSTFLLSNLGRVHAPDVVQALAFHPEASGRSPVSFGAATVRGTTTLTLRTRAAHHTQAAADALLTEFSRALTRGKHLR
jgi:hypothetical protein